MDFRNSRRKPVQTAEAIGHGGEATIYRVVGQPKILAKLYDRPPRKEYARKLVWMRDHPPQDPTASQQHASLAWPVDLLFSSHGQLSGYLMPFIEYAVPLLDVFNPRRCAEVLPDFNRRYLHRAARNLASALGALHACGYVVGDINESNILVTPRALVTMIDTDSFQVQEDGPSGKIVHTCPVARLEYTPPELQGKSLQNAPRSPEQDAFGLGVLVYQLLMAGNHPFRAQWLGRGDPPPLEERIRLGCFPFRSPPICPVAPPPFTPGLEILHPAVARLMLRCFVDGHRHPRQRPSPHDWEQALGEAEDNLAICQNGHYYSNHLNTCPVCNPRYPGRQTPLPALAYPRKVGEAQPSQPASSRSTPPASAPFNQPAGGVSASGQSASLPERLLTPLLNLFSGRSSPFARPTSRYMRRAGRLSRKTFLDSLGKGALLGAGIGALGGTILAVFTWAIRQELRWVPLLVAGALLAAAWRSLQIGQGFNYTVLRTLGWETVLKLFMTLVVAVLGGFVGWLISVQPLGVAIGIMMGGVGGWLMGDALWHRNPHFRWDLVGVGAVVLIFAGLAYAGISWLGANWPGQTSARLVASLAAWLESHEISRIWIASLVGILGGGFSGALVGSLTEALAEVTGFRR
jgi:serine/threonine protein kinase